jgi:hypothetical protein
MFTVCACAFARLLAASAAARLASAHLQRVAVRVDARGKFIHALPPTSKIPLGKQRTALYVVRCSK